MTDHRAHFYLTTTTKDTEIVTMPDKEFEILILTTISDLKEDSR